MTEISNDRSYREIDSDADDPALEVAKLVAEFDGRDTTDLSTMYECVDSVLDNILSDPPDPEVNGNHVQ